VGKGVSPSISNLGGEVRVELWKSLHERSLKAVKVRLVNTNFLVGLRDLVKLFSQLVFVINNVQKNVKTFNQELCRALLEARVSENSFNAGVGSQPVLEKCFSKPGFVVNVVP